MRKSNSTKSILKVSNVKVIKNGQKSKIKGGTGGNDAIVGGHANIYIVDVEQG